MAIDAQLAAYPYHRSMEKVRAAGDIHKPEKEDLLPTGRDLLSLQN